MCDCVTMFELKQCVWFVQCFISSDFHSTILALYSIKPKRLQHPVTGFQSTATSCTIVETLPAQNQCTVNRC